VLTESPRKSVVINAMTIDVEDYFHVSVFDGVVPRHLWEGFESRVCANTERLLQLFDAHDVTATFFVLGWVAKRFPQLVRQIAAAGHEVASHGYGHRLVYDQTPEALREDVRRAKAILEAAAGTPVVGYRAPSYSITPRSLWALDILIEEGYRYDSSIFPIRHDRYGIPLSPRHAYVLRRPRGELIEAPASTTAVGPVNLPIGGGGYFRILPYQWTRWGINRVNQLEGRPAIFYLHPWEIDPDQPRLKTGLLSRFRHYRNLAATESRMQRLLSDFRFGPMSAVLEQNVETSLSPRPAWALPYLW
jgi:polysaccharide deacetylase family protein (PEP-CTERM system associated)